MSRTEKRLLGKQWNRQKFERRKRRTKTKRAGGLRRRSQNDGNERWPDFNEDINVDELESTNV